MDYWEAVVQEVLHKDDKDYPFSYTNVGDLSRQSRRTQQRKVPSKAQVGTTKYYLLGQPYPDVQLTQRELDCALVLLRDHTIVETAKIMQLSPRTVEFYIRNMRYKLRADSKQELVEKFRQTDLVKQLSQETALA